MRDYLIKPFKGELLVERVGPRGGPEVQDRRREERRKRFDDPISILVVDDKPAIVAQIRAGLADTPWKVTSADQPGQGAGQLHGERGGCGLGQLVAAQ